MEIDITNLKSAFETLKSSMEVLEENLRMIVGITNKEFEIIKNILDKYNGEFYAYGSRVKGDFTDLSDLNIMVKTDNYEEIISNLKNDFDKSNLPYVVNFTNYSTMDEHFYNLIKNSLVKIK